MDHSIGVPEQTFTRSHTKWQNCTLAETKLCRLWLFSCRCLSWGSRWGCVLPPNGRGCRCGTGGGRRGRRCHRSSACAHQRAAESPADRRGGGAGGGTGNRQVRAYFCGWLWVSGTLIQVGQKSRGFQSSFFARPSWFLLSVRPAIAASSTPTLSPVDVEQGCSCVIFETNVTLPLH